MTETATANDVAAQCTVQGTPQNARRRGTFAGPKLPLSAFIICMDEEEYLANCIESLDQCAEIVIVDSGSTDGTADLVQSYIDRGWPIRFMHQDWLGYAAQKQFALEQCQQPWCLSIDSDERLDDALKAALPKLLDAPESTVGWKVARRAYLVGRGYTPEWVRERHNLRLIRKGCGAFDTNQRVHEGIVPEGEVKKSKQGSLLHYRPLIIDEHILKMNKYSTLKADQVVAERKRRSLSKLIFNPPCYFLRIYFLHGMWRCGAPGFIQAMTDATYSFLTEAKIYQRYALERHTPHDDLDRQKAA